LRLLHLSLLQLLDIQLDLRLRLSGRRAFLGQLKLTDLAFDLG